MTRVRFVRRWMIAVVLIMAVIFTQTVFAQTKTEIVIGTNLPLTGILKGPGGEQKWSYEQAVKDVNKNGGIWAEKYQKKLPVRLVIADDESNPVKAAEVVERLITQDKVDLLLGGFAAPFGVIPGCTVAEKHKKYYHTSIALVPIWLSKKFKWSTLFFFDLKQACKVPFQIWKSMPEAKRPKKPALFMENTEDGRGFAGLFRALAKEYGYEFAMDTPLPVNAQNYYDQIAKARQEGVDAILVFTSESDCIRLVRDMKQMNYSVGYLHGWKGTWSGKFWKELGKDAQYILCDGFWHMDFPYAGAKELGERYHKAFGYYSLSVGATYALCQILFQAIEKAGTIDGAAVRQAVLKNTFNTVRGPVKYNKDGVALFTSIAGQWWNGKQKLVFPFGLSRWMAKLAPPWDHRKSIVGPTGQNGYATNK